MSMPDHAAEIAKTKTDATAEERAAVVRFLTAHGVDESIVDNIHKGHHITGIPMPF